MHETDAKRVKPSGSTGKIVTVFGGSGFLGRHIVRALLKQGWRVRVAVRRPNQALFLKTAGAVGQLAIMPANIRNEEACRTAIAGADAVINLVGILHETGKQKFAALQNEGAARLARLAAEAGVKKFIQMSAIGADENSPSAYAKSKAEGEAAILEAIPQAVILRPSIVIGPEDDFFNRFAGMAQLSPALPLVGGGLTRYQPVAVQDVVAAVMRVLEDTDCAGKTYELGGAGVYTFRELMELLLQVTQMRRLLVPLPFPVAGMIAQFAQFLPTPPLTPDQVLLLKSDNIVSPESQSAGLTLPGLGITPTPIEAVMPSYLSRFTGSHGKS